MLRLNGNIREAARSLHTSQYRSLPKDYAVKRRHKGFQIYAHQRVSAKSSSLNQQHKDHIHPTPGIGHKNSVAKAQTEEPTHTVQHGTVHDNKAAEARTIGSDDAEGNIVLSDEQRQILRMVQEGRSVFFTGSAGTGKSVLLREIIRSCEGRGMSIGEELAVTAATGIASINIGGKTLHSWAGVGLGQEETKDLLLDIVSSSKRRRSRDGKRKRPLSPWERWKTVRTLIVDEISMIDGTLLDKLDLIARVLRKRKHLPFGGIQLVLSGDFCQLPPVPGRGENDGVVPAVFAFESLAWKQCIRRPFVLTKVFRQRDQHFVDILNTLRIGKVTEEIVDELRQLSRPVTYTDGIEPTELYPLRRDVEIANHNRLTALRTPERRYLAIEARESDDNGYKISLEDMERALGRLIAQQEVVLKAGAQVMLIKNVPGAGLVNGSQGLVLDFMTVRNAREGGITVLVIGQAEDKTVLYGDFLDEKKPQGANMLRDDTLWPLVKFTNGRAMLCTPAEFSVNNFRGEAEATRRQVPLICAWAMSVHKSQGQTLQRVRIDLGRAFEYGQAYVALSRATNMKTLQVLNFEPSSVMAHPRVLKFYQSALTVEGGM